MLQKKRKSFESVRVAGFHFELQFLKRLHVIRGTERTDIDRELRRKGQFAGKFQQIAVPDKIRPAELPEGLI